MVFRLKRMKKNSARRLNKNNQQISIITSENAGVAGGLTTNVIPQTQQQQYHDNRMNTQVKTYTDHGNGHSVMRTGNYSKVINNFQDETSSFSSSTLEENENSSFESLNEYIKLKILNNIH